MSTVVNTPSSEDSSVAVLIVGILFTVAVIALFFVYGLPAIRNMTQPSTPATIELRVPEPTPAPATDPAPTTTP